MTVIAALLPLLTILSATLLAALPWGAPGELNRLLPLLPYVLIHFWVERRPNSTPDWGVFLAGFAVDVTGQGPLGYWALIYLTGYVAVGSIAARRVLGSVSGTAVFAATMAVLVLVQWLVASAYFLRVWEFLPLVGAAAAATVVYAGLIVMFPPGPVERPRLNPRLERGG